MRRRTFLTALGATGAVSLGTTTAPTALAQSNDAIDSLVFDSTASILDVDGGPLTGARAEELVSVWAEPPAFNDDDDGNDDAVDYPADVPIPLVASAGNVVGFGAPIGQDDTEFGSYGNEEFLLNVLDAKVGGGTVLFDEGHGQFYDAASFSAFVDYAEANGYTVTPTSSLAADLPGADAAIVTSPSDAFSGSELDAVASFVADGGVLLLFDQSDFNNFDATDNISAIATAVGAPFRFNDDQVFDEQNNAGSSFVPVTSNFNDAFEFFADREGFGLELDRGETYSVEVVEVTDGDTVDVQFVEQEGQEEAIRIVGIDTPETGSATSTERPEEWEGIEDPAYLETAGEAATAFARGELSPGDNVKLSFDANEPVRDEFGRLLGFLTYDADGSGSRETLYNRRVVEAGHARVYGSGFDLHDDFWAAESAARDAGLEVWSASDPFDSPPIRDRPVEDLFFPNPATVVTADGPVDADRVPAFAEGSATRSGGETAVDGDLPLAAVDADSRLAFVGAPLISETYEQAEGYPVDTSGFENFGFLTDLLDDLSARDDETVLIEGGHGQFDLAYSLSSEDAAYYQRYLEGQDTLLEQVNDLTTAASAERLASARALVVTTPASAFSEAELDAVASFAAAGGAVVLLGSALSTAAQRGHLNGVAAGVGSDLRLGAGRVVDPESNLGNDESIPVTANLSPVDVDPAPDPDPVARIDPGATEVTVGERLAFRVDDTSGSGRWITDLEWTFGNGETGEGYYNAVRYGDAGEYTVTLRATDNTGATTTDTVTVAVSDLTDPIARLVPSTIEASVGERVTFRVRDTSGDERWIDSLDWTFGDGTTATGWWNAHRYGEAGEYTVTLRATDNTGATTTDTVTVVVE
jgi:endonuclease YncB( thermonuclease family)/chitodextrinase